MDAISKLEVGQTPQFRELTSRRRSFAWTLTILMLVIYYGFIALVAFAPGLIGVSVGGSITLGLVIGILVILSADHTHWHLCPAGKHRIRPALARDRRLQRTPGRLGGRRSIEPSFPGSGAHAGAGRPRRRSRWPGERQPTNWTAIVMFLAFVAVDTGHHGLGRAAHTFGQGLLCRGWRHHRVPERPRHRGRLHVGGIVPRHFGAGLHAAAIDGLIYSIGFLVGWPIIMFLMAERLRNLGRFTFADVVSYRLQATPIRAHGGLRHAGNGGLLSDRADGRRRTADRTAVRTAIRLRRRHRRRADDPLCHVRRHDGDDLGADHQGRRCCCSARRSSRCWCSPSSTSTPTRCSPRRSRSSEARRDHAAGRRGSRTRSRRSRSAWR